VRPHRLSAPARPGDPRAPVRHVRLPDSGARDRSGGRCRTPPLPRPRGRRVAGMPPALLRDAPLHRLCPALACLPARRPAVQRVVDDVAVRRATPQLRRRYCTAVPGESSASPRGTSTSASALEALAIMCDSCPVTGSRKTPSTSTERRALTSSVRRASGRTEPARRPGSNDGPGRLAPWSASSEGTTNSKHVTSDETGFPGSPKIKVPSLIPKDTGLPGLTDTPQKISSAPRPAATLRTRSCGPTETPPEVTSTSLS